MNYSLLRGDNVGDGSVVSCIQIQNSFESSYQKAMNEYYIFCSQLSELNGKTLMAQASFLPNWYKVTNWNIRFGIPHPYHNSSDDPLRFCVGDFSPLPDNLPSGNGIPLYSLELVNLLKEFEIDFELFRTILITCPTEEVIGPEAIKKYNEVSANYRAFNLLTTGDMIDSSKTEFKNVSPYFSMPKNIVLNRTSSSYGLPLVRDANYTELAFAHESVKAKIEEEGITGCSFESLNRDFLW